jgi:predicted nucleic-acid-binding protein
VHAYEGGRADFSDHLIGTRARRHGARTTYTFDRALRNRAGFTLLR